ncbi:MAG: hypothetical protein HOJ06_07730 [Rhodospirillaceae bacterium]|jgi:hypothetical protein|nr:hypothetical protein [Rhodospirillaceae bacterium]
MARAFYVFVGSRGSYRCHCASKRLRRIRHQGRAIFGAPEDIAAQVCACIEESGVNYFIARFAYGDISYEAAARSVDYFKEYVLDS